MDFRDATSGDQLDRLERKVNRLIWLCVAQSGFLAIAVLMYVMSLASTWLFWIALVLIVAVTAWALRDKSPDWARRVGRVLIRLMQTNAERTTVTVDPDSGESVSRYAG